MDVCFRVLWWLNLDNQVHIWNIETSGSDICCHQNLEFTLFKPLNGDFPLILGDVSMHDLHFLFYFLRQNQLIGILLGLSENNGLGIATIANKDICQCSHSVVERTLYRQVIDLSSCLVF